ncbi:MAG TPA: citrate synthase family protein [Rhizomicrobium sp.]|jgi:citrate synthase|nr:citrate synthase family protein [Rhizomicrobium sp.]
MNNSDEALYLTARDAATELAVSPATLYAYVSRGLIRSEPGENPRSRRYRAEDVRSLKNRRAPLVEGQGLKAADLPVMDSAVSTITEEGPIYRGVRAVMLAETATFEQCASLLWDAKSSDPFAKANLPVISPAMRGIMAATRGAPPIDRAIAVLSQAAEADPRAYNSVAEGRAATGARILRLVVATMTESEPSAEPLHRQIAHAWAPAHRHAEDLIRRALVLLADHELNASTFTVRCAASTGISLYDAVIAGMAALKGPRHGGVGPLAAKLLDTLLEGDVAAVVRERVALGEKFPGFGHMIYRDGDPRGVSLFNALLKLDIDKRLALDIPQAVREATGASANCDYALAVMRRVLGMPVGSETTLFAMARVAGWVAHASEQFESKKLIRPRARYIGPAPSPARKR